MVLPFITRENLKDEKKETPDKIMKLCMLLSQKLRTRYPHFSVQQIFPQSISRETGPLSREFPKLRAAGVDYVVVIGENELAANDLELYALHDKVRSIRFSVI